MTAKGTKDRQAVPHRRRQRLSEIVVPEIKAKNPIYCRTRGTGVITVPSKRHAATFQHKTTLTKVSEPVLLQVPRSDVICSESVMRARFSRVLNLYPRGQAAQNIVDEYPIPVGV
jgi:hypothetical protein